MTVTVYRRTLTVTISTNLVVDESKCSRSKFTLIYTLTVDWCMWQHTDFPVSLWWLSRPDRGQWPWWTGDLPSFRCIGDDTDLIISECAVQTWAINPLVEPPTHANFFWQNLHFALQEVGFSKYCQHEDSFTLFAIVVDSLCNDYVSAGSIYTVCLHLSRNTAILIVTSDIHSWNV